MKHTEEEVIEIAKRVAADLGWDYDVNQEIHAHPTTFDDHFDNFHTFDKFEEVMHLLKEEWTVSFMREWNPDLPRNQLFFIDICDETGEPLKVLQKRFSCEIVMSPQGKYKFK